MKKWKCQVCGYIHTGDEPPAKCPVCGAPASAFILVDAEPDESQTTAPAETAADKGSQQWKCRVCGYDHTGGAPPDKCPVCAAPSQRFDSIEIEKAEEPDSDLETAENETATVNAKTPSTAKPLSQLIARAELITKLHGHPIAVHIPNGVLPLTFLFTLFAVIFKSEGMAIAAKYNMIFVCLSMPIVLVTGVIDWFNRFNAQMTYVFQIKMGCGAAVSILSLILALWWTVQPNIYLGGEANIGIFLFLNFVTLAIAAIAGFYGGKLVFRD